MLRTRLKPLCGTSLNHSRLIGPRLEDKGCSQHGYDFDIIGSHRGVTKIQIFWHVKPCGLIRSYLYTILKDVLAGECNVHYLDGFPASKGYS